LNQQLSDFAFSDSVFIRVYLRLILFEKAFDDTSLVIYYARQHWKGGDSKYMSSYHSEVAAA
jgi:hypothetical protein